MPNRNGHAASLVPAPLGNRRAEKHGLYSAGDRALGPGIAAYREELLALPHVAPVDAVAVDECARLLARIEAVDRDLDERGHFGKRGAPRRIRLADGRRAGQRGAARNRWYDRSARSR